jgi:hypothetical protein
VVGGVPLVEPGPDLVGDGATWLHGIRRWDGGIIALGDVRSGDPSYRLEPIAPPEATRAVPLLIPGAARVVDVAMRGDTPLALVATARGLALATREAAGWSIDPVPEPGRQADEVVLAARPDAVALLSPSHLHLLRGGAWTSVAVAPSPAHPQLASTRASRHAALLSDHLLLGLDAGEWGGALLALDLASGTWTPAAGPPDPVTDLLVERGDAVWVSGGLAHLSGVQGSLLRVDPYAWAMIAQVRGSVRILGPGQSQPRSGINVSANWAHGPASFDALAFDREGRLVVGTGELGLFRREGTRFVPLTPRWPRGLRLTGLVMEGSLAVIATSHRGVVLWDTRAGKARRIDLPR